MRNMSDLHESIVAWRSGIIDTAKGYNTIMTISTNSGRLVLLDSPTRFEIADQHTRITGLLALHFAVARLTAILAHGKLSVITLAASQFWMLPT